MARSYERSPLNPGGFSCFSGPPSRRHRGQGTLRVGGSAAGTGRLGGVVAESLERSYPWAVGFFFGNVELSLELWTVISGISGSDD